MPPRRSLWHPLSLVPVHQPMRGYPVAADGSPCVKPVPLNPTYTQQSFDNSYVCTENLLGVLH